VRWKAGGKEQKYIRKWKVLGARLCQMAVARLHSNSWPPLHSSVTETSSCRRSSIDKIDINTDTYPLHNMVSRSILTGNDLDLFIFESASAQWRSICFFVLLLRILMCGRVFAFRSVAAASREPGYRPRLVIDFLWPAKLCTFLIASVWQNSNQNRFTCACRQSFVFCCLPDIACMCNSA